ncbi:type-F conjugative transfer system mating-pair stabilization protein TraN [Vibrio tapetis]|uniref:Mating pair stabilization protein TraN n=1 Tax=Vibrio tapetis subsp. tapetis TaxID=1671868 RepID=A0A2N8ZNI3_9VIBR|nr:Mating pair stabilization protein TraN [Vibrio tapetis subsp. tapetis]
MRTFLPRFITLLCLCSPMLTHANQAQTYNDSAQWAKHTANQTLTPSALPLNAKDYCKDAACKSGVDNPKESQLDDSTINSQKAHAFATNDIAQDITHNFNQGRPDIKNDPAMRFALLGQENAFEVTHGISNAYVDCKSGSQCVIDPVPRQCNQPTRKQVPCEKVPIASVTVSPVIFICPQGWTNQGRDCTRQITQCRYDARNSVSASGGNCGRLGGEWMIWDGRRVQSGKWKGKEKSDRNYDCRGGRHSGWSTTWEICGLVNETMPATLTCQTGFSLSGGNCIKNTFSWSPQCTLIKACKPISETCIEGEETRIVNGIPTTLPCWKYQINHECNTTDTCKPLPNDCTTTEKRCSLKQNGVCVEEEVQKSCPEKTCHTTALECGEQSFCLDGDCYQETPKLNVNFDKSVAALAGLAEAVKDVGSPPKIFTGKPMQCEKKIAGFNDCCSDSGWGQGLGAKCSEQEKALGKAKGKGLTLYVGEFCAKKILGACLRHKRSYFVYDSKLAKIIQQQGAMSQLGKGLGSSERPTCAPLTPEELGQINFEHIDFAEFYPEMKGNTNLPNFDEIKNRLQSATGG